MSGVGPSELLLLVVIGLLILGPERLPRVASQIGRWVGRARRTANQLRYQLEREITLADIEKQRQEKQENETRDGDGAEATPSGDSNRRTEPEPAESPAGDAAESTIHSASAGKDPEKPSADAGKESA